MQLPSVYPDGVLHDRAGGVKSFTAVRALRRPRRSYSPDTADATRSQSREDREVSIVTVACGFRDVHDDTMGTMKNRQAERGASRSRWHRIERGGMSTREASESTDAAVCSALAELSGAHPDAGLRPACQRVGNVDGAEKDVTTSRSSALRGLRE